MRYFPLFIDLQHKHILIVGAGKVGQRKVATLLQCPTGSITVIDVAPCPNALQTAANNKSITYLQKSVNESDITGASLVFAATNLPEVNSFVATLCNQHNILCNIANAPEASSFTVPATITNGPITIALGTEGTSPALSKHLRQELEDWLGNRYTAFAVLLGRLRPLVLTLNNGTNSNTLLFRSLVQSPLAAQLASKSYSLATQTLKEHLPVSLHPMIGELIHDL